MAEHPLIRADQPEFLYNEFFPGNHRPIPIYAKSVDPEAVRTTLNAYRDNFEAQKRFSRDLRMDLKAANKRIDRCLNWLVALALFGLITLGIALR